LGDIQPKIEKWLDTRMNWKPNVMGQCKSWLNDGLADRAVTRDLNWGVPVPLDDADGKVLYVWFDAPIGYISATKEWAIKNGDPDAWKTYWQDENTRLFHFIGKDNIVFHCIMFPAMLMEHGDYVLPENVPANEFLNLEGRKLSTSRGWAVWLHEYLQDFDPDYLRYALGCTLPETKDSDFSWKDFQARVNNELADVLGNFVFRTLSFTEKFADARVPELNEASALDREMLLAIAQQKAKVEDAYDNFRFRDAIQEAMQLARIGNQYFTKTEPWKTRKENPQACLNTLHVSLQICAALSLLFEPVLPHKMKDLRASLSMSEGLKWADIEENILKAGTQISSGDILFSKIEDDKIEEQLSKLMERSKQDQDKSESSFEPLKENIKFEDFMKLDLRPGIILDAEKVEKSNKLLKLQVDIGIEKRTIVSGIAKDFDADSLKGQKVVVVANLAPKKLMGIESQGMILMAETDQGKLKFLESDAPAGSLIS
jgi:methionyl-tRNA synthetase